jgi:hypothetical protein
MSLSRKHYCAVAAILKAAHTEATIELEAGSPFRAGFIGATHRLTNELACFFGDDNPNFDRARFLAACKVQS